MSSDEYIETPPESVSEDIPVNVVTPASKGERKNRKFSEATKKIINFERVRSLNSTVSIIDEDTQECWPATAAWFLGPKAENLDLLKELIEKAIDEHADFRKYKYFPLDPKYVTKSIQNEPAFEEAKQSLIQNLDSIN